MNKDVKKFHGFFKKSKRIPFLVLLLWMPAAEAGIFQFSLGFSFSRSNYGQDSFTWTRRYSTGLAYHFTDRSGVEFSYQNGYIRTKVNGNQDTSTYDSLYSLNWVQHLLGKELRFQPYVKLGVGQLDRSIEGSVTGGSVVQVIDRSILELTVVMGVGFKVYIGPQMTFDMELSSYLLGGQIKSIQDNIYLSAGTSIYF